MNDWRDNVGFSRAQRAYDNMEPPEGPSEVECKVCGQPFVLDDNDDDETCDACIAEQEREDEVDEKEAVVLTSSQKLELLRSTIEKLVREYEDAEGLWVDHLYVLHVRRPINDLGKGSATRIQIGIKLPDQD